MNLIEKFKETIVSVLPIMAAVVILNFTVAPLGKSVLLNFLWGGFLIILGLTLFLSGVDMGISPMGERAGAALTAKRNLFLLLICSFFIGIFVTIAEPDVQVLVDQVKSIAKNTNKWVMVLMIALGVGVFVALGIFRTVARFPLKIFLFIFYVIVFVLAFFADGVFQGVAFDSGGATTGPMTVPFIMALGLGVSAVRSKAGSEEGIKDNHGEDSFGLTGIASIGPIAAVCIYGILFSKTGNKGISENFQALAEFSDELSKIVDMETAGELLFIEILKEVSLALCPLLVLFFFFQIFLLKLPRMQIIKTIRGLIFSFVGLVLFLLGAKGGFMDAGNILGEILGKNAACVEGFDSGEIILLAVSFIFGAIVVCAEPAVWILTEQVENVSGGTIKRKLLLGFLSVGVALSIVLSMLRVLNGFSLFYVLVPGYALSFLFMLICPNLFTGIAFDSGGVASGPMTSTFILSFALGVSKSITGTSSATDAFGVIAFVAMTPLIAIQVLGIIFRLKNSKRIKKLLKRGR